MFQRRAVLASLVCLFAAACASPHPATESEPAAAAPSVTGSATASAAASAAPAPSWESWPPAQGATAPARVADRSGPTVRLEPKAGGWRIEELFDMVNKQTGISFLYDSSMATFKQAKVEFVGTHVIPESELFPWLQAVLSYRKLVLVPVGPKSPDGKQQWLVMDLADPNLKSRPVFLDEAQVLDYEDRDGLYVVTTLRCRDTVDTTRARNALSPLTTQTAGIGRIMDIPGSRVLVVGDFAPIVAAMKRLLDIINANTAPGTAAPPAPAMK